MSEKDKTKPRVFIIESLDFEDEKNKHFEGEIISKILNFSGIECKYNYIRTKAEFEHFIQVFQNSNYRYLHISCHGNTKCLATTLEQIPFPELGVILQPVLDKKRLFISACSATNDKLADEIFPTTECYSLIGPSTKPNMNDAAIFWASFYHLMFNHNSKAMKKESLQPIIEMLSMVHNIPIKYYTASRANRNGKGWAVVPLNIK